jgi:hypothetical protein
MLTLRQLTSALWTFFGFMVAASLVLNLRYKSLDDGALYVDTWTGKTHSAAIAAPAPAPDAPAVVAEARKTRSADGRMDVVILERLERLKEREFHRQRIRVETLEKDCSAIRPAFLWYWR